MSDYSYVRRQASSSTPTPVFSSSEPASRHLLLVETHASINRDEIAAAKYDNVDVIYVSRETLPQVADMMKQFNIKWRSINMLFHGSADLGENSVDMFGIKMSMNQVLMAKDPNVIDFIAFTKDVCKYTDDSLYIYTCAVGLADGFKSLCLQMDVKLASGIFLSTNITGNGAGQDWDVEWGTKTGFLTAGVHTNEIEHAQICLFKEIKLLTFTLAITVSYTANHGYKHGSNTSTGGDELTGMLGNTMNISAISMYQIERLTKTQLRAIGTNIEQMLVTPSNPLGISALDLKVGDFTFADRLTIEHHLKTLGAKKTLYDATTGATVLSAWQLRNITTDSKLFYEWWPSGSSTSVRYDVSRTDLEDVIAYAASFRPIQICLNDLTDDQLKALLPEQVAVLPHTFFDTLDVIRFQMLNVSATPISRLNENMINKMSPTQATAWLGKISPTGFTQLLAPVIQALVNTDNIKYVDGAAISFVTLLGSAWASKRPFRLSAIQIPRIPADRVMEISNLILPDFLDTNMFQYLNGAGLKVGLFKPVSSFQTNDHREIQQLTPGQTAVLPVDQVKLFTRVQLDRLVLVDKFKYLNGAGLDVPSFNGNTHAQIKQLTLEQAWVLPVDQVKLLSIPQQDILLTRGMYQYLHGAGLDVSRYGKAIVIDGVTYKFTLTTRQIVQLTGAQVAILRSSGCDMTEIDKILTPIVGLGGNLGNIGNAVDTSNLNFNFGFDMSNIKF